MMNNGAFVTLSSLVNTPLALLPARRHHGRSSHCNIVGAKVGDNNGNILVIGRHH